MMAACCTSVVDTEITNEPASLTLNLSPGLLSTKAGDIKDGYAFHNVLVIIANDANKVVGKIYKEYDVNVASDVVSFEDLKVGTYHVYAYANIDHENWQSGNTISTVEKNLAAHRDGGDLLDSYRELKVMEGRAAPASPTKSMLLTGHRVMSVGSFENIGSVDLLRPVTRLNVYIQNHTDYKTTLKGLSFSDFNPSNSYLLRHWDSYDVPVVPAGTEYRSLPAYDAANPVTLESGSGRKLAYSTLLWEGAAETYRMFANVEIDFGGGSKVEKELVQNSVTLLSYDVISNMAVGETKNVMLVSPNAGNGAFFGHTGSANVKEQAKYRSEASYSVKAMEILNDYARKDNYILTLARAEDVDGKKCVTLQKGTWNPLLGNNWKKYAYLEEGAPVNDGYPVSNDFKGCLVRFRTDAWQHYDYLRNSGGNGPEYNNTGSVDGGTSGDYQWALYEVDARGSTLRLIDNETAQVTPLTYMRRNQELNVVMNIYFQQEEHKFDFVVDNAYWTEGHEMEHTYN